MTAPRMAQSSPWIWPSSTKPPTASSPPARYEVTKDASGPNIDDAVHALNAGLNEIFAKFAADLGQRS